MEELKEILKGIGDKNGLEISLDETGACTLELSDGRVLLIQERARLGELDFAATLGPVPEERREPCSPSFSPRTSTGTRRTARRFHGTMTLRKRS